MRQSFSSYWTFLNANNECRYCSHGGDIVETTVACQGRDYINISANHILLCCTTSTRLCIQEKRAVQADAGFPRMHARSAVGKRYDLQPSPSSTPSPANYTLLQQLQFPLTHRIPLDVLWVKSTLSPVPQSGLGRTLALAHASESALIDVANLQK